MTSDGQTDRQTDGRTQSHSIDPLCGLKATYVGQWRTRLCWAFQKLNFENRTNRTKVMAIKLKMVSPWKGCFKKYASLNRVFQKYVSLKRGLFWKFFTKNPWKGYIFSKYCYPWKGYKFRARSAHGNTFLSDWRPRAYLSYFLMVVLPKNKWKTVFSLFFIKIHLAHSFFSSTRVLSCLS